MFKHTIYIKPNKIFFSLCVVYRYTRFQPYVVILTIVATDLKNTGTCHYTITKETFWSSPLFLTLRKNSPYTSLISKGYVKYGVQRTIFEKS